MRPRDIINRLRDGTLSYIKKYSGPNRRERRETAAKSRVQGIAKMSKRNWTRDRHKRRRVMKARRKQAHRLYKPY